jgi:CBS domain-containing protein
MRIHDVMTQSPFTVDPATSIVAVRSEMSRLGIHHVLVTKDDRLVGITTDADIRTGVLSAVARMSAWEMWELDATLSRLTVSEIMSKQVITIDADCAVHEAVRMMLEHGISGLPVLSGRTLVGIVTDTDLLRALATPVAQLATAR